MKAKKVIKMIAVILLVAILAIVSFVGIYIKDENGFKNIVKDYILGMEFTDSRVINFEVNKEENAGELLTVENYKQTKSIIKNRLKKLGVDQYKVALDEITGNIQVRIPENEETDLMIYYLLQSGSFELKDSQTQEVLMDTSTVKKADVMYSEQGTATLIFLQIEFNKDAKQKLAEISNIYTTAEETKSLELYLNGQVVTQIIPEQSIMNDMLYIGVGIGIDSESIEQYAVVAEEAATILNSGVLPLTYTETDTVEAARITVEQIKIGMYVALGILALMVIVFIIRLKTKGILASILQIGYIALLLLALRYTNVKITIEGIAGILISSIINFTYIYIAFRKINLNFVKDVTVKFALRLIPIYFIAIILSFNSIANIYSLGMTLVWGIIVMYLYNLTLTQITLKTIKE